MHEITAVPGGSVKQIVKMLFNILKLPYKLSVGVSKSKCIKKSTSLITCDSLLMLTVLATSVFIFSCVCLFCLFLVVFICSTPVTIFTFSSSVLGYISLCVIIPGSVSPICV